MSTAVKSKRATRQGAGYWAQAFGLLLAIALVSPASARPLADLEGFVFDSGEIEAAVSFGEGSITTPSLEPAPVAHSDRQAKAAQPYKKAALLFGMETEPFAGAAVSGKWSRARGEIARELDIVARCHESGACPADARKLIALSAAGAGRDSRAKIGLINRAVDLAIRPVSDDAQWGVPDHWSAPFETLRLSRGDCEDYAIVKYLALLEAGIPRDDLKIVILNNAFPHEDHAVVAVRIDDQWLILDNRTLTVVRDMDLTRATPKFVLDQAGVRRFVSRARNRGLPLWAWRGAAS
jgi:predicted transglutaminase-like cysteine proteinase